MRLVIVEDEAFAQEAIWQACAGVSGWEIVGQADTGAVAIELIPHVRADTIVLDLVLGDMSGFLVAEHVRAILPGLRILVLSGCLKPFTILRLDGIGVQGYISKARGKQENLREALAAVAGGGTFFSEDFQRLRRDCHLDPLGAAKILTRTQRRVLSLVGACMSDAEIGDILGIAESTVESHRRDLRSKLDLHGPQALIKYSQSSGFALGARDIIVEAAQEMIAEAARAGGGEIKLRS